IFDNIVAFWRPHAPTRAGEERRYGYRLHWAREVPSFPPSTARVVATRTGRAGRPGQPRPPRGIKHVLDFEGGPLARLGNDDGVEAVVSTSRGAISNRYALRVVGTNRWRAAFDLAADGDAPVELR